MSCQAMAQSIGFIDYITPDGNLSSHPKYPTPILIDSIKDLEVTVIPKMNGILPIRKAQAITGAQALFAILYTRSVFEHLGFKDYGGPNPRFEDVVKLRNYFDVEEATKKKFESEPFDLKAFESEVPVSGDSQEADATPKS